ncbi:MAG: WD40 repeat domain-containing protein [Candidatus Angelobacter sp.]
MKKLSLSLCLCLFAATLAVGQAKKAPPVSGAASAAAKICNEPYAVREDADGWPEGPVTILFHREKSNAPWTHNPAIRVPGLEAAAPASARTVVCVEESRVEMGHYDSGEPGYAPSWGTILVRLSDRKVYFMGHSLDGEMPPQVKYNRGAGVGKPPTEILVRWLRLLLDQKVARFKMRLKPKEYHEVSAMAFSADGSRLAVAQETRSTLDGTPPSPITVFDLATATPVASMHADYSTREIALSKSGSMVATNRYGGIEVWDVATAKLAHKLETSHVTSLAFGPDDTLGLAGDEKAAVWDVAGNRMVRSGSGSIIELSPEGTWLVMVKDAKGFTVRELESGRELANFPGVCGDIYKCLPSRDGKMMVRWSSLGEAIYSTGNREGTSLSLPNLGVGMVYAAAPTHDGFVIANSDGIAGIVSAGAPEPRAFATDMTSIKAIAVSQDGKLVALGDSSGTVEVWELR